MLVYFEVSPVTRPSLKTTLNFMRDNPLSLTILVLSHHPAGGMLGQNPKCLPFVQVVRGSLPQFVFTMTHPGKGLGVEVWGDQKPVSFL